MGDYNINLLNFEKNKQAEYFLNNMFSQSLIPLITKPTRITQTSATLIDNIFTNNQQVSGDISGIVVTDLADHFGIYHVSTRVKTKHEPTYVKIRSHKAHNLSNFKTELQKADFSSVYDTQCPNLAYDQFIHIVQTLYDNTCPQKNIKLTKKVLQREPWVSEGIVRCSKNKSKLYLMQKQNPSNQNIQKYKNYCKIFNKVRRTAQNNYYTQLILV